MSSGGKAGSGRGNSRKRPFKRRGGEIWQEGDFAKRDNTGDSRSAWKEVPAKGSSVSGKKSANSKQAGENSRGSRGFYLERPKWIPPTMNTEPLPATDCPWCGKPIRDIFSAITDKDTGAPVHFDCVTARIAFAERPEKGEMVAYIGGGRFGIISFENLPSAPPSPSWTAPAETGRGFTIKKIIEWEYKDKRAEWRSVICDRYSVT